MASSIADSFDGTYQSWYGYNSVKYFALCRLAQTYFPEVDPDSLQTISDTFARGTLEYLLSHKAWELHQTNVLRVDYARLTSGLEGFSTVLTEVIAYLKAEKLSD